MESLGISAHGTTIRRDPLGVAASGAIIAELKNITPPPLSRNMLETTTHNSDDDSYVVGIRRKGTLSFQLNFLYDNGTHDHQTGLVDAWEDGDKDKYTVTFPDGTTWKFSGFVASIAPTAPVDGVQEAAVTIRPSGGHLFTA